MKESKDNAEIVAVYEDNPNSDYYGFLSDFIINGIPLHRHSDDYELSTLHHALIFGANYIHIHSDDVIRVDDYLFCKNFKIKDILPHICYERDHEMIINNYNDIVDCEIVEFDKLYEYYPNINLPLFKRYLKFNLELPYKDPSLKNKNKK